VPRQPPSRVAVEAVSVVLPIRVDLAELADARALVAPAQGGMRVPRGAGFCESNGHTACGDGKAGEPTRGEK
jgi:hypothetical protein